RGVAGHHDHWISPDPVLTGADLAAVDARLVRVPALLAALRRRWRLCAALALIGLVGGIALSAMFPVPSTGTVTVMVGHPSGSDPARNVLTDVELARTFAVAQLAADRLGAQPPAATLQATFRSANLSSELVQLKVDGPTAEEAIRRVDALADAFVDFRRDQFDQQWQAAAAAISQRQGSLTAELAALEARIAVLEGGDPAASPNVQGLAELQADQIALTSQIATLSQQLEAGGFDAEAVRARTQVVDAGHAPARALVRATGVNLVAGVLFGLVFAAGWVIVVAITSDRVRGRAELSVALGAPVAVSVGARSHFRGRGLAGDGQARVVRHLRRVLAEPGPAGSAASGRRLLVLAVDRVGPAAAAVAALARELAADDRPLLVADVSGQGRLPALFGVAPSPVVSAGGDPSVTVVLLGSGGVPRSGVGTPDAAADTVLVLATLDPAVGAHHLAEWATTVVAVVTAGRSTATWLRSVAEMVADAGLVLDSAVLLEADPRDETLGRAGSPAPAAATGTGGLPSIVGLHRVTGPVAGADAAAEAGPSSARAGR
ncbi:MAG: hypothetical protein QOI99_535, partial [Actinomycetota bacterium]|nr:hypothetical protein [Actinomycetota bacterium]